MLCNWWRINNIKLYFGGDMNSFFAKLVLCITILTLSLNSYAFVMFQDDFNTENGGAEQLNYSSFDNWNVYKGSVDLINSPGWFSQPLDLTGHGMFLDMDGSTSTSGGIRSKTNFFFETGIQYNLSFDLAGNNRSRGDDAIRVVASLQGGPGSGNHEAKTFTLNSNQDFMHYNLSFIGQGDTGKLIFRTNLGPHQNDNIGILLDNVMLERIEVAEPAGLALIGFGLFCLIIARKRVNI